MYDMKVSQPSIRAVQVHMLLAYGPCSSMLIPSSREFLGKKKSKTEEKIKLLPTGIPRLKAAPNRLPSIAYVAQFKKLHTSDYKMQPPIGYFSFQIYIKHV